MKTIKTVLILLLAGTLSTFAQKKEINLKQSDITWTGKKIGGSHTGEIKIKSGYFEFKNNALIAGKIVIDMTSITNTDLEDASSKQKLVGHLKSDDFFGVEKYPTSSFVVTKASKMKNGKATVSGTITIKGKTDNITFDVVQKGNIYTAQMKIDRSKFDVRYGSNSFFANLGNKTIDNIFVLDVKLTL